MSATHPKTVLSEARARSVPWPQIVDALNEMSATGTLDEHGRPWVEVAAQLSGYTTNQLRQAQRTYRTIETLIEENNAPSHALRWPMSNLEVICRISKVNLKSSLQIIESTTSATWRDLTKTLEELRDDTSNPITSMSAGHKSARVFTQNLLEQLSDSEILKNILGREQIESTQPVKAWPGRYPFAHPDFVVSYYEAGKFRLAAFEGLRFYGDINLHAATKAAVKAAVEATFFAKYYWCLSGWTPTEHLEKMRDELGLGNVGLIEFGAEEPKVLIRPMGRPMPDRQSMLFDDGELRKRLGIRANARMG